MSFQEGKRYHWLGGAGVLLAIALSVFTAWAILTGLYYLGYTIGKSVLG